MIDVSGEVQEAIGLIQEKKNNKHFSQIAQNVKTVHATNVNAQFTEIISMHSSTNKLCRVLF